MPQLERLISLLRSEPAGPQPDRLLESTVWETLDLLLLPEREGVASRTEEISDTARSLFSAEEPSDSLWRLWYAGQLEGLARLLRAHLGRELALSTTALLRGRKHALRILAELLNGDGRFTDLARSLSLDESHLAREVKRLARHDLVETQKEGRCHLARITHAGRAALARFAKDGLSNRRNYGELYPNAQEHYSQQQLEELSDLVGNY